MSDLLLVNGQVITSGPARSATTILVRDGCITGVGDARIAGSSFHATRIDLDGRTVIPAFHDAHAHIWKIGHLLTTMLDLRGVESIDALVDRVRQFRMTRPDESWLLGRGYNEAAMAEGRPPTRADLDLAAPDHPVVLTRVCGHICVANSAALAKAGIDT